MSRPSSLALIIANQTLGGVEMLARVEHLNTPAGLTAFHLLVPATPVGDAPWQHGDQRRRLGAEEAELRLERGLELITELGAEADGEVGEPDPIDAVRNLFDRGLTFDRVLLSTLPVGLSRWLHLDVPHRLARITDIPVEHIESEPVFSLR
ncbi:MAG: hypothetical protein GY929_19315 [Actinomycetia bacterium]|nr:hypothetical protein [Actinomycetes bacterium]